VRRQHSLALAPIARQGARQQCLVISHTKPLEDEAFDPGSAVAEDRGSRRARRPVTMLELCEVVAGALTEERSQFCLVSPQKVEHNALSPFSYEIGVVDLGDADQEAGWPDTALCYEPN
jgi:hypothetical protein